MSATCGRMFLVVAPTYTPRHHDTYSANFRRVYRKYRAMGLSEKEFALQGGAAMVAGEILDKIKVIVRFNHMNLCFVVDPQDSIWFERLRSELAAEINKRQLARVSNARHIRIEDGQYPEGEAPLTGDAVDMARLANVAVYGLRVRVLERPEGRQVPVPARQQYVYPPVPVPATDDVDRRMKHMCAPIAAPSATAATKCALEVSENARRTLIPIAAHVLALKERMPDGYREAQEYVLKRMTDSEALSRTGTLRASLEAAACPDVARTITDLSRDLAARCCKAAGSIAPDSTDADIMRQANIACECIFHRLKERVKAWRCRRALRHPCPQPMIGGEGCYMPVQEVCAPLGKELVETIQNKLVAASYVCPYTDNVSIDIGKGIDGDYNTSDDEATPTSSDAARHRSGYRRRKHKHTKHKTATADDGGRVSADNNNNTTATGSDTTAPYVGDMGVRISGRSRPYRATTVAPVSPSAPSLYLSDTLLPNNRSVAIGAPFKIEGDATALPVREIACMHCSGATTINGSTTQVKSTAVAIDSAALAALPIVPCNDCGAKLGGGHTVYIHNAGIGGMPKVKGSRDENDGSADMAEPEAPTQDATPARDEVPAPAAESPVEQPTPGGLPNTEEKQAPPAVPVTNPALYRPMSVPAPPMPPHGVAIVRITNMSANDYNAQLDPVEVFASSDKRVQVVVPVHAHGGIVDVTLAAGKYVVTLNSGDGTVRRFPEAHHFGQRILHGLNIQKNGTLSQTVLNLYIPEKLSLSTILKHLTLNKPTYSGIYVLPSSRTVADKLEYLHVPTPNPTALLNNEITIGDELLGEPTQRVLRFAVPATTSPTKQELIINRDVTNCQMQVRDPATGATRWASVLATMPISSDSSHVAIVVDAPLEHVVSFSSKQ